MCMHHYLLCVNHLIVWWPAGGAEGEGLWTGVWGTGGRRILTSAQSVIQEVPQPHQSIIGLKSKVPFMHPSLLRAMVMDEEALCNLLNTKCNLLFLTYQTWSTFLNFLHSSTNSCNTSFCWINSCWRCSVPLTETEEIEITRWVSLHTRYLTIFCSFFAWLKNGGKRKITWWCVPPTAKHKLLCDSTTTTSINWTSNSDRLAVAGKVDFLFIFKTN